MGLRLVWSSVAQGPGKAPPQGPVTHKEPKGLTNWSPCWALLWAKCCWFEELPWCLHRWASAKAPCFPPSFLASQAPSIPWQAENILSPLHSTPPPLVTGQAQGISGASLVYRENEEDEHGATAHSGSLSSEAPVVAQPAL